MGADLVKVEYIPVKGVTVPKTDGPGRALTAEETTKVLEIASKSTEPITVVKLDDGTEVRVVDPSKDPTIVEHNKMAERINEQVAELANKVYGEGAGLVDVIKWILIGGSVFAAVVIGLKVFVFKN